MYSRLLSIEYLHLMARQMLHCERFFLIHCENLFLKPSSADLLSIYESYDKYRGVISMVNLQDGVLRKGESVSFLCKAGNQ